MNGTGNNDHKEYTDILHKLNQPLTAIGNYAQAGSAILAAGNVDPQKLRELFDKIVDQADRSFAISKELQELGKQYASGE